MARRKREENEAAAEQITQGELDTTEEDLEIAEQVASQIKSGAYTKPRHFGKTYPHLTVDDRYRASGQLEPRWVLGTEERITRMRLDGWKMPSEWSPKLEDRKFNELVLMLRATIEGVKHRNALAEENRRRNEALKMGHKTNEQVRAQLKEFQQTWRGTYVPQDPREALG
jgi:hypothetical protein